jgi:hypothetical protein
VRQEDYEIGVDVAAGVDLNVEQEVTTEREVPCAFLTGKRCCFCKQFKSLTDFHNQSGSNDGKQGKCKSCAKDYRRLWYSTHPHRLEWRRSMDKPDVRRRIEKRRRLRHWNLRLEMIAAYGGKCSCCGINDPQFLTLEHLKGGGREHRRRLHKSGNIYLELKNLGWPKEDYTCLCFNCNSAKGHFGVCPHERRRIQHCN